MKQKITRLFLFIPLIAWLVLGLAACNTAGGEPSAEDGTVQPTAVDQATAAPQATDATMATAAPETAGASLDAPFVLGGGQEMAVADAGLTLRFTAVPEDSRCPTGVTCVWAGRALVDIEATLAGQEPVKLQFDTTLDKPIDILAVGDYSVQLLKLDPYPEDGKTPIAFEEYQANLVVTK